MQVRKAAERVAKGHDGEAGLRAAFGPLTSRKCWQSTGSQVSPAVVSPDSREDLCCRCEAGCHTCKGKRRLAAILSAATGAGRDDTQTLQKVLHDHDVMALPVSSGLTRSRYVLDCVCLVRPTN